MKGHDVGNPFKKYSGEERRGRWGTTQKSRNQGKSFCFRGSVSLFVGSRKTHDQEIQQGHGTKFC